MHFSVIALFATIAAVTAFAIPTDPTQNGINLVQYSLNYTIDNCTITSTCHFCSIQHLLSEYFWFNRMCYCHWSQCYCLHRRCIPGGYWYVLSFSIIRAPLLTCTPTKRHPQ